MVWGSDIRGPKRPSLRDPVLVFAGAAALALLLAAGWRPALSAPYVGIMLAVTLVVCRVGREFRFHRWTERALRNSEWEARILADGCANVVVAIEPGETLRCAYVSASSHALLGRPAHPFLTRDPCELVHPEDAPALAAYLATVQAREAAAPMLCRAPAHGLADTWLEATGRIGSGSTVLLVLRDVTRQRLAEMRLERANSQLQRLMMCDDLTGLANRRCFDAVLHREASRLARTGQSVSMLLIGVDRFAMFVEIYGQAATTALLARLAQAISGAIGRPADLAARFGEQEFAVLLPETDADGASQVAERVRAAVRGLRIVHCGSPERLASVSIGLATIQPRGRAQPGPTLVRVAQHLVTRAAQAGGDRVCAEPAQSPASTPPGSAPLQMTHTLFVPTAQDA